MHSLEAMVRAKLSSANLEEPRWTNIILDHFPHAKLQRTGKKLKEDRKIITEIISLAFFQNENFSNIASK